MVNAKLCNEVADWAESATDFDRLHFDMTDWISGDMVEDAFDYDAGKATPVPVEKLREGSCGTAACVAGYVALMRAPKGTTTTGSDLYLPDGEITECDIFAEAELGITHEQGAAIFYTSNENAIARLRHLAENPDASSFDLERIYA